MRRLFLLAALLACLPAGAAEETKVDERLEQQVTITEPGDRLAAVLERLTKKTGVKMHASLPLEQVAVVCRYDGTLSGFMVALAHFFALDREDVADWHTSSEEGEVVEYLLTRPFRHRLDELRKEREATLARAMDQAVRDDNRWVKHLGQLTDQERFAIYSGGAVSHPAGHFGGRRYLDEVLLRDAPNWPDETTVTYAMTGHSPLTRMFTRTFTDPLRGDVATEGFAVSQLCPALAPEKQQQEWRQRYGDPAPQGGRFFSKEPARLGLRLRREILLHIAERAKLNLIADDYGQALDPERLPSEGTLSQLLDGVCQFQFGAGDTPETNHGSFWRKCGDVYLVRSLAWPEEEVAR